MNTREAIKCMLDGGAVYAAGISDHGHADLLRWSEELSCPVGCNNRCRVMPGNACWTEWSEPATDEQLIAAMERFRDKGHGWTDSPRDAYDPCANMLRTRKVAL